MTKDILYKLLKKENHPITYDDLVTHSLDDLQKTLDKITVKKKILIQQLKRYKVNTDGNGKTLAGLSNILIDTVSDHALRLIHANEQAKERLEEIYTNLR